MKYTFFAFLFLSLAIFLPQNSLAQKMSFTKKINKENNRGWGLDSKYRFFIHELTAGKLSPVLKFKEGIEISEESISEWACLYKSFGDSGFLTDDSLKYINHEEKLESSDSVYFEKVFLEVKGRPFFRYFLVSFIHFI